MKRKQITFPSSNNKRMRFHRCVKPEQTASGYSKDGVWKWSPQKWTWCDSCNVWHGNRHIPKSFWNRDWPNRAVKNTAGVILTRYNGWEKEFFLVECYHNCFSFPKGTQEKNESLMEAAERELLEETGLNISLENSLEYRQSWGDRTMSFFHYHIDDNIKINPPVNNPEITGWGFVSERDLKNKNLNKTTRSFLSMIYRFK